MGLPKKHVYPRWGGCFITEVNQYAPIFAAFAQYTLTKVGTVSLKQNRGMSP